MLNPEFFYRLLINKDISFYCGVPDSLLKDFLSYLAVNVDPENNIITANEGNAIALSAGYYLATGNPGLVYMQNSGLGNCVNPLLSLTDPEVYSIPSLLLIGWRGEPGKKDEPQHVKQGKVTNNLLKAMKIPFSILPDKIKEAEKTVNTVLKYLNKEKAPYALIVKKGTFESYKSKNLLKTVYELTREDTLKIIVDKLSSKDMVVATTGETSRELFEYRDKLNQGHNNDFLTVGSMGHSSHIALGIAKAKKNKNVYCIDGDGSLLMHMGALAVIGSQNPSNFKHIVINNGAHCSVGGQLTCGFKIDIPKIAKACGYNHVFRVKTKKELVEKILMINKLEGPSLIEVRVKIETRKDLGRPTITPRDCKKAFMNKLRGK
ncbi:MAG: phosphonopyruvate decarboxylase [Elusimicrobia bacterium RIFOXYA2_FULL_39_19]|nr:MAG: phosphonopyruvate decarboxylase [Elusimicrobia bacterium RIFOXYA2_FULL_39_19]